MLDIDIDKATMRIRSWHGQGRSRKEEDTEQRPGCERNLPCRIEKQALLSQEWDWGNDKEPDAIIFQE